MTDSFTCVFCKRHGANWIRSTTGWIICDACGEKQPPKPQPTITLNETHETRINYLQRRVLELERRVGHLEAQL